MPAEPTLGTLLEGTHNSDLVTIRARLVAGVIAGRNVTLVFQTGDQLFKGLFNLPASTPLSLPGKNSLVTVTGITPKKLKQRYLSKAERAKLAANKAAAEAK